MFATTDERVSSLVEAAAAAAAATMTTATRLRSVQCNCAIGHCIVGLHAERAISQRGMLDYRHYTVDMTAKLVFVVLTLYLETSGETLHIYSTATWGYCFHIIAMQTRSQHFDQDG